MKRLSLIAFLLLAPQASAATRHVGSGQTYATVALAMTAAGPQDSIVIHPSGSGSGNRTYYQDWVTINKDSLIMVSVDANWQFPGTALYDSTTSPIFDGGSSSDPTANQGIWRTSSTLKRLEINGGQFLGANNLGMGGVTCGPNGPNAVPFRFQQGGTGLFWVRNVNCHDNNMNFNGGPESLLIENSIFFHPNTYCGNQHNLYIQPRNTGTPNSGCNSFTIRGCLISSPRGSDSTGTAGNGVKTRATNNYILYNRIVDGSFSGAFERTNYNIDIPEYGLSFVIGNVLEQKNDAATNTTMLAYGAENSNNTNHHLWVFNNTFVNLLTTGTGIFINTNNNSTDEQVMYKNNIFYGQRSSSLTDSVWVGSGVYTKGNNYQETSLGNLAKFFSASTGDYRLTAASPNTIVDDGTSPGTNDGFNCDPTLQYVHSGNVIARTVSGSARDIGAFEFLQSGGGGGSGDPCTPFMWEDR